MTSWTEFASDAGQLTFLIALTGLIYRLFRMKWPDVPEAVMQFVAVILSTCTAMLVDFNPLVVGLSGAERMKWIVLALAKGLFRSQNIIKSIDWVAAATTQTGAPSLGINERPPQWYVDAHPEKFPAVPAVERAPRIAKTLAEVTEKARVQAEHDSKQPTVEDVK